MKQNDDYAMEGHTNLEIIERHVVFFDLSEDGIYCSDILHQEIKKRRISAGFNGTNQVLRRNLAQKSALDLVPPFLNLNCFRIIVQFLLQGI